VIQQRLRQYHEKTEPLVDYYDRKGMLRRIDASRDPEKVGDQIRATLASLKFEAHMPPVSKPTGGSD
jgi:adenylate kinase